MTEVTYPTINELCDIIHKNAIEKGFYEKEVNMGERIALIHSEASEALEADRKDKYIGNREVGKVLTKQDEGMFFDAYEDVVKGTFSEEMADIVIRVMDLCAYKKIDLELNILAKIRYNKLRPKYHGKKY